MEQAQNQIYNAFREAGLEKEARQLSIKINGKIVPALGHYIAFVDQVRNGDLTGENYDAYTLARLSLQDFLKTNQDKIGLSCKYIVEEATLIERFLNKYKTTK